MNLEFVNPKFCSFCSFFNSPHMCVRVWASLALSPSRPSLPTLVESEIRTTHYSLASQK